MTDDATGDVLGSTTFELPGYAVERTVGVAMGFDRAQCRGRQGFGRRSSPTALPQAPNRCERDCAR
jgi:hypothetical protein